MSFSLEYPLFLLLFIPFVYAEFRTKRQHSSYMMPYFYTHFSAHQSNLSFKIYLKLLSAFLALVALSQPTLNKAINITKENAIDIVLSLDISGSMSSYGFAQDYNKSRLDVVQGVVNEFITQRKNDRVAVVAFGTNAKVISPLSFDAHFQKQIIKKLEVGLLGKSTALIDSILVSTLLLKESSSKSKVLIVLSDGEDSSSKVPLEVALRLAKKEKIKIYTISIDASQSDMMQVIAKESATPAFFAQDKKGLQHIYQEINRLEKTKIAYKKITVKQSIFLYFLAPALLFLFIILFLSKRREI
jgi:Ca-activated chloride channel family protein